MSTRTLLAVILIALGIVAFAYQGITYNKPHTTDIGPVHVTTETKHTIPIPPIAGAIALVGGIAILMTGRRTA